MSRNLQKKSTTAGSEWSGRIKYLLIGTFFGILSAALFSVIFSFLMPMSFAPEWLLSVFVCLSVLIGGFVSGFVSLRLIGSAGLVNGLLSGVLFAAVHLIVAILAGGMFAGAIIFVCLALELVGSAAGGVFSVNLR